ncbi:MAG: chromosome segregation protein [Solirubrobacteraceae bacterium]|nr:chromosome segregation protein [Solirubrobacteraceae bacterium]
MHLRSITLKGFKSFPDRTRMEFTPGVSVIVGPNGSGKSNITDAVLWALGEQSPLAVRGQSMQDVIFAGAHGVQARGEAEVEVVLDNADGAVDLPAGEIAVSRRLNRAGDGEYRINGARCRLGDVIELMSDTGMGKEMHSVVSQGRVEGIVTSKPRDRRLLIEEAAGLGKHRKRRRRAQLKLERTQSNLDRALDVEREARTRLRPLKRQAEAAELHERLERQTDEARWSLAREDVRAASVALAEAETAVAAARAAAVETERELAEVAARRERAEEALASRGASREAISNRFYSARSAGERVTLRLEGARDAQSTLTRRAARRRELLAALDAEAAADVGDDGAAERIAGLEAELSQLDEDRHVRLERELAELEQRRAAAALELERRAAAAVVAAEARSAAEAAAEEARRGRRAIEVEAESARRDAARTGAELAKVNQFLRSHAGAPGGAPALADAISAAPGYELALAAAIGPRLRAAVAGDLPEAAALLDRAGRDGGAALVVPGAEAATEAAAVASPPAPGATPLLDHVRLHGDARSRTLAAAVLAGVWLVDDPAAVAAGFAGVAVTRDGRVWSPGSRELRQVPPGGEDRVLAERNRRDELIRGVELAAQAEQAALARVEAAAGAVAAADAARDEADRAAREAARAREDAAEAERHARRLIDDRRRAPAEGGAAERRAQLEAAIASERRLAERAERDRADRARRVAAERTRLASDEALIPAARRLETALAGAAEVIAVRVEALGAELEADRRAGDQLAGELRACAGAETQVQARLKARGEEVTRGEVRAQQSRDRAAEGRRELAAVAGRLGLDAGPGDVALDDGERAQLEQRIERLGRRREQLGPVNPLAQQEYAEAVAHVEELEGQRDDLETALRELETLIRDTDKRIREAFEETFAAAAANFEEVAAQLFPGGHGRLRLVKEDAGPRPVIGGAGAAEPRSAQERADELAEEEEEEAGGDERAARDDDDRTGVEIEITPAGKSTKRLTLLSGGEKSMTALAFLFAVFLARPCPFYILDEVEAALDDLNIDRFLTLLRRFSDRAQFIVVTHQKRTMEAADCLYGVSMAGNGVSKVISRRLPPAAQSDAAPESEPSQTAAA